MKSPITRAAPLALALSLVLAGAAAAQMQAPPPAQGAPATIPDAEADAFASALVELQDLQQKYAGELQGAEPNAAAAAQEKVQKKSLDILDEEGISPERYNEIVAMMNADPTVRDAILEKVQEAQ